MMKNLSEFLFTRTFDRYLFTVETGHRSSLLYALKDSGCVVFPGFECFSTVEKVKVHSHVVRCMLLRKKLKSEFTLVPESIMSRVAVLQEMSIAEVVSIVSR